jgi:hypothetical protein
VNLDERRNEEMGYTILFDVPEDEGGPLYVGLYKDSLGWARTLDTARIYESAEIAQRVLDNNFHAPEAKAIARVIEVDRPATITTR